MLHVARYDKFIGYICVMCKVQMDMAATNDFDHGDDCPGWVEPAKGQLAGSDLSAPPAYT
jgi:hypothetical protein